MAWQICLGIFLFCTILWWLTNVIIPGTSKAFEDMTTRKNMTKKEKEKMFKMWRDYTKHKKNDYIDFRDMLEKEDIKLYNLACNKYKYRQKIIEYWEEFDEHWIEWDSIKK